MKFKTGNQFFWLSLLVLLFSFAACDTGPSPSTLYMAGTYTERADGYGGAIKVSAVLSDDSITKITIDSHKESVSREPVAKALEQIPQVIIDDQTLAVDSISGATYTSRGILKAVEKCVLKAGGESAVAKLKP